jgi:hypothetical protein
LGDRSGKTATDVQTLYVLFASSEIGTGSLAVARKSLICMASLFYKSPASIPVSGIYRVLHAQHRLPHEVTLISGQTFPPCSKCHNEVRFELVRELPELARERRGSVSLYSLPVLDEEEEDSAR